MPELFHADFYSLIAAVIVAIPGYIAAIASVKGNKKSSNITAQLKTGNDLTIAEMVEDSHAKLSTDDTDYEKHHEKGGANG